MSRLAFLAALTGTCFAGEFIAPDISLPVNGGRVVIRNSSFIEGDAPILSFEIVNESVSPIRQIRIHFDIGGSCGNAVTTWTDEITTFAGWASDHSVGRAIQDHIIPLIGKVDGCHAALIRANIVEVNGIEFRSLRPSESLRDAAAAIVLHDAVSLWQVRSIREMRDQEWADLMDIESMQEAREAERAAALRRAADNAARSAAAAQRAAAEKKEAERQAAIAKAEAESRARMRKECSIVFQSTSKMKIADLTIPQLDSINACRDEGLYH
ncbi:MAG TPA: hypothetical protein VHC90_09745 [Bryobacteraceae bacterium]|nr:hypothetical protein [Bryobacteraceae bacterium]